MIGFRSIIFKFRGVEGFESQEQREQKKREPSASVVL